MKNTILLVAGQKGGDGKTTLAVSMAVMRKRAGRDVILVDADGQQNATKWVMRRSALADTNGRVQCSSLAGRENTLADAVRDLAERYEDIVIDVGGYKSKEFLSALTVANRLISPIRSSQFDLDTMFEVDRLVGMMKAANPALDATWFCNMVSTHATARLDALREANEALADLQNMRPLQAFLSFRRVYEFTGRGVLIDELSKSDSQEKGVFELNKLYTEAWQ